MGWWRGVARMYRATIHYGGCGDQDPPLILGSEMWLTRRGEKGEKQSHRQAVADCAINHIGRVRPIRTVLQVIPSLAVAQWRGMRRGSRGVKQIVAERSRSPAGFTG